MRAIILIAILGCGCSVLGVRRAPNPPPRDRYVACTSSKAAPALDLVLGTATLAGGIAIAGANMDHGSAESDRIGESVLIGTLLTAVVFGVSAGWGFSETSRCEEYKEQLLYDHMLRDRAPPTGITRGPTTGRR